MEPHLSNSRIKSTLFNPQSQYIFYVMYTKLPMGLKTGEGGGGGLLSKFSLSSTKKMSEM